MISQVGGPEAGTRGNLALNPANEERRPAGEWPKMRYCGFACEDIR